MTAIYSQKGDVVNVPATAGCTKDTVNIILAGVLAGVNLETIAANAVAPDIPVALVGVHNLTKVAGSTTGFALGARVYATSAGAVNSTATGDTYLGNAIEAAATTGTKVLVRLNHGAGLAAT